MYDIFISYRRKCRAEDVALLLFDKLTQDGYSVSHDHSTFHKSNQPFDVTIDERIDNCTDFVCIISQDTFDRCEEPDYEIDKDWMVHEIQYAITKEKNIIPIRLEIDKFPINIPQSINCLSRYNGPRYSADLFDGFYQKLKDSFKTESIQQQQVDALYEKAIYKIGQGNYSEGVEMLFEAGIKGSAGACLKLGQLYLRENNGEEWNIKYDPEKGKSWITKAYLKNYPPAYYELGVLYMMGLSCTKESKKAVGFFKKGVELGDSDCMNELGLCYLNGIEVAQDDCKAVELFREGADKANAKAALNYAMCYREGRGVPVDAEKYFIYVKYAASLDLPIAHHYLACAYYTGEGTHENLEKAFVEFEKAYHMGELDDCYNLAICYENGYGTTINKDKARGLLKECLYRAYENKRHDLELEAKKRLGTLEY